MNSYIFAGLCNKTDVLLSLCKVLTKSGFRVLLIDATADERYRYCIDEIHTDVQITEFEGFDVAFGFSHFTQIEQYLDGFEEKLAAYDFIILDMERKDFLSAEHWISASARVWATDYTRLSLERGRAWITDLMEGLGVEELPGFFRLYTNTVDTYLENFIWSYFDNAPIRFHASRVIFHSDEMDTALRIENEHYRRLTMKPLSKQYKRSLAELIETIIGWDRVETKRALQMTERRRA
ncbi:hypothetical protein M3231_12890 [Neobacillus mesonae]|nr:hypothetical protein [Neobacillus mesonae]